MKNITLKQDEIELILNNFKSQIDHGDWTFLQDKDEWTSLLEDPTFHSRYISGDTFTIFKDAFAGFLLDNGIDIFDVSKIPANYMRGNTYIFNVTIPERATSIGSKAFANCINLKKLIINHSVKHIDSGMCMGCIQLNEVKLPSNCSDFDSSYAFFGCISLETIVLPPTMKKIGKYCFAGSGLTSIDIPSSIDYVDKNAFDGCKELTEIHIDKHREEVEGVWHKDWNKNCSAEIFYKE